jgi:hypothetical protein
MVGLFSELGFVANRDMVGYAGVEVRCKMSLAVQMETRCGSYEAGNLYVT